MGHVFFCWAQGIKHSSWNSWEHFSLKPFLSVFSVSWQIEHYDTWLTLCSFSIDYFVSGRALFSWFMLTEVIIRIILSPFLVVMVWIMVPPAPESKPPKILFHSSSFSSSYAYRSLGLPFNRSPDDNEAPRL